MKHLVAIVMLLIATLSWSGAAFAEDAKPKVSFDVNDASLLDLTIWMSHLTQENFVLLDKDLENERITIYAPEPVTIDAACEMFVTALRLRGLTVENTGEYWKITKVE